MRNCVNINRNNSGWKILLLFVLCLSRFIGISCQLSAKFINENSTLLFHPLINATQAPLLINSTEYDLLQIKKLPWHCLYSTELEEADVSIILSVLCCARVVSCFEETRAHLGISSI